MVGGMGMEFDKVLMGIFLCWTPQSALAAVGLILAILISQSTPGGRRGRSFLGPNREPARSSIG